MTEVCAKKIWMGYGNEIKVSIEFHVSCSTHLWAVAQRGRDTELHNLHFYVLFRSGVAAIWQYSVKYGETFETFHIEIQTTYFLSLIRDHTNKLLESYKVLLSSAQAPAQLSGRGSYYCCRLLWHKLSLG